MKPDKAAMSLCLKTISLTVQSVHLTQDRTDFVAHDETWVTLLNTSSGLGPDSCVIAIETCKRLGHGIVGQDFKSPLAQKDSAWSYRCPVFTDVRTLKFSKSENQVLHLQLQNTNRITIRRAAGVTSRPLQGRQSKLLRTESKTRLHAI